MKRSWSTRHRPRSPEVGVWTRGPRTTLQQPVPLVYYGCVLRLVYYCVHIEVGFRADLIVEDLVIVEIKPAEVVAPVHKKQLLTHLRQGVGLLIQRGPDRGLHQARC